MNKAKYNFILIFIILISLIVISSCNKNEENNIIDDNSYYDTKGYNRTNNGLYSECIILDETNYNLYKNDLIGDSGESKLINKDLINLNQEELNKNNKNYLVCYFYCLGLNKINIITYLKISLINESKLLFDLDAVDFDDYVINQYMILNTSIDINFDMSKDPFERLTINIDEINNKPIFFTFTLPFNVKEEGKIDIDLSFNESNLNYEYQKSINTFVGNNLNERKLVTIDNYNVSYISESVCKDGLIDESKLSNNPNFVKNYAKLMVVDFDLKALEDNDGTKIISLFLNAPDESIIKTTIEDAPSSDVHEEISEDRKTIRISIKVPREKDSIKHYRLVYRFIPLLSENIDIDLYLSGNVLSLKDYKKDFIAVRISNDGLIFNEYGTITGVVDDTLSEINIPGTHNQFLVKIGENAFANCKELCCVNVENGVIEIGNNAFLNCSSLEEITLPESIEIISSKAFDGCPDALFTKDNNCYYLGNDTNKYLYCIKALDNNNIFINPNTKTISNYCFEDCPSIENINFMNVEYIGDHAFNNCVSLKEIDIPNNVLRIGEGAFSGCINIKKMSLPFVGNERHEIDDELQYPFGYIFGREEYMNGIETKQRFRFLDDYAEFKYYIPSSLEEIIIKDSKYILFGAFSNCKNLKIIEITKKVELIKEAFSGCSKLEKITLPFVGEKRYKESDATQYPFGYIFGDNVATGDSTVQYYYDDRSLTTVHYYLPRGLKEINITDINYLQAGAFSGCYDINKIIIPDDIKAIKYKAFYDCLLLKEINIPTNCEVIGDYAFYNCLSIENIDLNDNIYYIGNYAFYGCNSIKEIRIPSNVTSIGEEAFCDLFELKDLYFDKPIEDWNKIIFNDYKSNPMAFASNFYILDDNGNVEYQNNKYSLLIELTISNSINKIGNYQYYGFNNLKELNLHENINSIGVDAFKDCPIEKAEIPSIASTYISNENLKEVKIISGAEIERAAFDGSSIKNLEIASSITEIGSDAFKDCPIEEAIIPSIVSSYISNENLKEVNIISGNNISSESFKDCKALMTIELPSSIKRIDYDAFLNCESLKNIYYDGTIENWCDIYFENINSNPKNSTNNLYLKNDFGTIEYQNNKYESLTDLIIPSTIQTINDYAFSNFNEITNIKLPSTITKIGRDSFIDCNLIPNLYYDGTVENWCGIEFFSLYSNPMYYSDAFYILNNEGSTEFKDDKYDILTEINISNITRIGDYQFYGFSDLKDINLPSTLTKIGEDAFKNCPIENAIIPSIVAPFINNSKLKDVKIISGKNILDESFKDCNLLSNVELPNTIEVIGNRAFVNCIALDSIELPSSLTKMGEYAFYGCSSLENIIIPSSINFIGENAFSNCNSLKNINLPKSIKTYTDSILSNSVDNLYYDGFIEDWMNITFDNVFSNPMSYSSNFFILDNDGEFEYNNNKYTYLENFNISSIITKIGNYQFYGLKQLKTLIISSYVKTIGEDAFCGCDSLNELTIKKGVTNIGNEAFYGCTSLKNIEIPSSVKEIGYNAFRSCKSLTDVVISNGVTTIGGGAFYDCTSLKNIELPSSLTNIGIIAFSGCKTLSKVYYDGTKEEWQNIEFSDQYSNPLLNTSYLYVLDENGSAEYNGKKYKLVFINN